MITPTDNVEEIVIGLVIGISAICLITMIYIIYMIIEERKQKNNDNTTSKDDRTRRKDK